MDELSSLLEKTRLSKGLKKKKNISSSGVVVVNKDFKEEYFPELTKIFDNEMEKILVKKSLMPRLLSGPPGVGKTSSIYRAAEKYNWTVHKFDSSMDFAKVKDELFNLVELQQDEFIIIFIDDLENNIIPKWFHPKRSKETGKWIKNGDTFLEKVNANLKSGEYILIAATNNAWKLDSDLKEHFLEVKSTGPYRNVLKKIARQEGMNLGPEFPRDIRQFQKFLKSGGRRSTYNSEKSGFEKVRNWFLIKPRNEIPTDMRPRIEKWITANMFNGGSESFVLKNQVEFYEILSILCLADMYNDRDFLRGLPYLGNIVRAKITHPSTFKKSLAKTSKKE